MRVPGPPSSSASVDVAAAARSDAVSLGLADDVSVALVVGLAEADAVALADGVGVAWPFAGGADDGLPAWADGAAPEVALGVVALGVVGFGAAVVGFGLGFGTVFVGVGALVLVAAGGAMPGCWPEPNRKPTTEPGAGWYDPTPLEL